MANLFGKNKLKEIAQNIDTEKILPFMDIVRKWHNNYQQETLKANKENSHEQQFQAVSMGGEVR